MNFSVILTIFVLLKWISIAFHFCLICFVWIRYILLLTIHLVANLIHYFILLWQFCRKLSQIAYILTLTITFYSSHSCLFWLSVDGAKSNNPAYVWQTVRNVKKKNTWRCRIRTSSQVRCMLTVVEVYLMNFSLILIILPLNKTQYTQMQRRRRKILMKTNVFKQNQ